MKRVICALTLFVTIGLGAQDPPANPLGLSVTPANTASPESPTGQTPIAALTHTFSGLVITNQFGANLTASDLASVLATLQNDLQQALPIVTAFNANLGSGPGAGLTSIEAPAANSAQNLGSVSGQNLAQNVGANVATQTGTPNGTPNTPATSPGAFALGTNGAVQAVPPTTTPPFITSVPGRLVVPLGTNAVAGSAVAPDTARRLLLLQNDIERMLPQLAALNGGGLALSTGFSNQPGATVTNYSIRPATPARYTAPQRLPPTGR
jgi:hypothetical protein